jgi:ribonuclease HI
MHYGWETRAGTPVKNQDLWLCLFAEIEKAHRSRLSIKFWHIPRGWNKVADFYAKEGAETERRDHFTDLVSPKD